MAEILTVDLKDEIPGGASIEFLRAEMAAKHQTPFALIRYTLDGVEQEDGLRMDLDKQIFLDQFEDQPRKKVLQRAAPKIVEYLSTVLHPQTTAAAETQPRRRTRAGAKNR